MKSALCLQHVSFEGPRVLASSLSKRRYNLYTRLVPVEGIPKNVPDFLLIMGGPMSVNHHEPWVGEELEFIQEVATQGVPTVGICLGSQLLAKAFGGRVVPGPKLEIGFCQVSTTLEGQSDTLFSMFLPSMEVFQWHGEGIELPPGVVPLASSSMYPTQAFRLTPSAYGLLFHLELDLAGIRVLCKEGLGDLRQANITTEQLIESAVTILPSLHDLADRLIDHLTSH